MPENHQTRWLRWKFNLFPAYRGTGAKICYIASDFREIRVELPLSWRTKNYVGTIFGGSIYGAVDPIYMIMLIKILGPSYVVWDKSAVIRFRRPGKTTLHATFTIAEGELDEIRRLLQTNRSIDRVYSVDLADSDGIVYASIEKTIYIRKKDETRDAA